MTYLGHKPLHELLGPNHPFARPGFTITFRPAAPSKPQELPDVDSTTQPTADPTSSATSVYAAWQPGQWLPGWVPDGDGGWEPPR
jgi:hypothetical protein